MDSNECGHCLTLLYEEGAAPVYRSHLFFHSRHSGVEEEANEGLAASAGGRPVLIAVGSNKFGHALCVIEEV